MTTAGPDVAATHTVITIGYVRPATSALGAPSAGPNAAIGTETTTLPPAWDTAADDCMRGDDLQAQGL